ncbi:hypothetical protein F5Y19DRAFT_227077 [Xylariaceae sp. FL1651]|nr:hypothetical protein F5Y19DRAFT_227077 [Xylariaceae sp. FL1651]
MMFLGASSLSSTTSPADGPASPLRQMVINKGAIIGGVLGAFFFLLGLTGFLAFWYRIRNFQKGKVQEGSSGGTHRHNEYYGKPELEGSLGVRRYAAKAELDAMNVRAELEETPGEGSGAGLHVLKPELEGTQGIVGQEGVYLKKKSELEDRIRSAESPELFN